MSIGYGDEKFVGRVEDVDLAVARAGDIYVTVRVDRGSTGVVERLSGVIRARVG